jgi:hypothetical protein
MTGPEHYREAERLLDEMDYRTDIATLTAAQVHATLALAAAALETRFLSPQQQWGGRELYIDNAAGWAAVSA